MSGAGEPGGGLRSEVLRDWATQGTHHQVLGHRVFVAQFGPEGPERDVPLLVLHGFPTSSVDYQRVVKAWADGRRVVLPDLLGYGLSDKPDRHYSVELQADVVVALTAALGLERLSLLTHDMGDTVGGELLARQREGTWPVTVDRRVVTNGSIYIESARLTDGQQFLLSLPDERLPADAPLTQATVAASLRATFTPGAPVPDADLEAASEAVCHGGGHLLLPRLIRYIEDRRRAQDRYTGAIERHRSPLAIVWGADDPIAVVAMSDRLHRAAPGSALTVLDGVGHYPMLEAPQRFADAVLAGLG